MESITEPCPANDDRARMERTLRRHLHDVRNCINTLDLEAALLLELVTHPEALESVGRMRWQVAQLEAITRGLSVRIATPQPVSLTAPDLLQLWKSQVAGLEDPSRPFEWSAPIESKRLEVDPAAITSVLRELTALAMQQSSDHSIQASVRTTEAEVITEVRAKGQPVEASKHWLEELDRIVGLNGGKLQHAFLPATAEWVSALRFPVATD